MQWVAHVYLNNFYSSVQTASHPGEEPLLILRHNRVLDMNGAAKASGVRLGSSRRHAYQCCPSGLFIDYLPEDYQHAARTVLEACLEYTPVIEPVAENEFYLELNGPHSPDQVIRELSILTVPACGTAVSAGVGRNKFLSKVANMALTAGRVKPAQESVSAGDPRALTAEPVARFCWLRQEPGPEAAKFLNSLPLFYLWPLEDCVKERLTRLGFATVADLASLEWEILRREFGREEERILALTSGQDQGQVLPLYPPKQLEKEYKFPSGMLDAAALGQKLNELALIFPALWRSWGRAAAA